MFHLVDKVVIDAPLELRLILIYNRPRQTVVHVLICDLLHLRQIEQLTYRSLQCVVTASNEENDLIRRQMRAKTRLEPANQMGFPRAALPIDGDELMAILRIPHELFVHCLLAALRSARRRDLKFMQQPQTP